MAIQADQSCFEKEWKNFVENDGAAIFQTALLLSANREKAGRALLASIDGFDLGRRPQPEDLSVWEKAIVIASVAERLPANRDEEDLGVPLLLQPGLWPLLGIEEVPRICFVLVCLLGYTSEACANLLDLMTSDVLGWIAEAAIQLQRITHARLAAQHESKFQ